MAVRIQELVDAVNQRAGRTIARTETQDVAQGARYLAAADFCVASGRSALEALALARPALIVWGSRYLGMVDTDSIQQLAATNFQGWNASGSAPDGEEVRRMSEAVHRRLEHPAQSGDIQAACARFVEEHYTRSRERRPLL